MPKRRCLQALACYLAIPVILIGGGALFSLIDPEIVRGRADYVRDYRLPDLARSAGMLAAAGLTLMLWMATCYPLLNSRQRTRRRHLSRWFGLGGTTEGCMAATAISWCEIGN